MKTVFKILKVLLLLLTISSMYLASHFTIGSQEDWNKAIESRFWEFYSSRLIFTLTIGGFIFLLSILLNWSFRKTVKYKRKMVLLEIAVILLLALTMTTIAVMK